MNPQSPVITELQPLLDALCEETITPGQLQRLEELVLSHPEAEKFYIRFMSLHAAVIGHVAGLPAPTPVSAGTPAETVKDSAPAKITTPTKTLAEPSQRVPKRSWRASKIISWSAFALLGILIASQVVVGVSRSNEVSRRNRELEEKQQEYGRLRVADEAARDATCQEFTSAFLSEQDIAKQYVAARAAAKKAIEERPFTVRVTGPTHVQPGAPNKWQIETLRHGAVGRPKKLDVIVKDAKDKELLRQTHEKPVGLATLEISAAFWSNVDPGTELFLEVVSYEDGNKSVLAERLPLARPVFVTHLVTDKPLYKPGETVRFRSLTLDRSSLRPPEHELYLIFKLRDPANTVIPLEEGNGRLLSGLKPVLGPDKRPLRGIGVGEFVIPEEAPGGEYKLDLYEWNFETGKEALLETRKFIVNRYVPDIFEKKLEFDGKSYGPDEMVRARIDVSRTAGGPMVNAKANVVASSEGKNFHEQKDAKFTAVTDSSGTKVFLDVRFKLPAEVFDNAKGVPNATLSVSIQDGSDVEPIVRPIPLVTKTLKVDFFPEGGDMIAGTPGRVYFMVRTPAGKPADLKGYITDGTDKVEDVATLTDAENPGVNRGHGVFTFIPEAGKKYFLKLTSPGGITEPTKNGYELPTVKADGIAMTALDAVTPKGGAIRVRLQSPTGPKTLHVGAYVREKLIAQQKVVLEANKPQDVSLKGDDVSGGVVRVTVFDAVFEPRVERLVFRESGERLILHARPDKQRYSPSDKVHLDLAAFTEKGQPTPAVLLVAVVNRSVITMADNKNDRLQSTHFLLSGEVRNSVELEHADFLLTDHPKAAVALDLLLATQGWRRFAEQEAAPANPADRPDVEALLLAHGQHSSAPVELFKLEQQRVNAEFAPKMEVARLRTVAAHDAWKAQPSPMTAQLSEATAAVAIAASRKSEAENQMRSFTQRYSDAAGMAKLPVMFMLIFGSLFLVVWGLLSLTPTKPELPSKAKSATATEPAAAKPKTKPTGSSRVVIALIGTVGIILVVLVAITSLGEKASSTFSFVGSAIKPGPMSEAPSAAPPAPRAAAEKNDGRVPQMPPIKDGDLNAVFFDPVGAPDRPKTSPRAWYVNGNVPGDWRFTGSRPLNGLYMEKPAPGGYFLRDRAGEWRMRGTASDKESFARTLRPRPPQANIGREYYAFAVNGNLPPTAWELNTTGVGLFNELDEINAALSKKVGAAAPPTPFFVREYAHQRDPSLGQVRSDFTETVYWHPVLVLPDNGKTTVEFQLSDDIARYQVLVAGHTLDGRIGAITQTIEARKPFSVDPKLPVEISHTDTVDVPLRVTNDSDVRRTVTFKSTLGGFKTTNNLQDTIELGPNGKGRKMLRLTADRLDGYAALLLEANSGTEKDSIARTIRVVPDGFPRVGSYSDMLEKGSGRSRILLPKDAVPGTLKVRLEMYPTSMADLLKGLEGMLQEPHGCFEQTSTTNYPNTLILDYLNETNQANPEVARRAKSLLDKGYGRLTSFECPDTPTKAKMGFEWFGKADHQHEALTAYGLLQFKDMARVHAVDPKLIQRTQEFLMSRRDGKGGFTQKGNAYHSWGGSTKVVDAYIVWALVESDPDDNEKLDLKKEIAALKAEALDANSEGGKDAYFVALVANVMTLRNDREAANKLLDRLKEKHFKNGVVEGARTSVTQSGGRALQIETTALALLGWLRANDPTYAMTVKEATKWISQQRGGAGGFGSTQSTILALKALTLYAKKSAHPAEAGELRLSVGGKVIASRKFTEKDVEVIGLDIPNAEEVFKPGVPTDVEIATDAKHPYPFALAYTYNTRTPESAEQCAVKIGTKLAKADANEGETVPLSVTLENKLNKGHGMAVAIVGIPAGMKVPTDMKQLTDLREKEQIAFFEIRGRELVLYWRGLAPEQKISLTVDLVCETPGVYRGPASRGYLYYDADHKHWVEPLAVKIAPMSTRE